MRSSKLWPNFIESKRLWTVAARFQDAGVQHCLIQKHHQEAVLIFKPSIEWNISDNSKSLWSAENR